MDGQPNFLGIRFADAIDPMSAGWSVQQYGVYDGETGDLIGLTVKIGEHPTMMLRIEPIPAGAIRFDEERPQ